MAIITCRYKGFLASTAMHLVHQDIKEYLTAHSFEMSPSELHGMLSGLVCTGFGEDHVDDWLPVVFCERHLEVWEYSGIQHEICNLLQQTRTLLEDDGFGFQLVLPDDTESVATRLEALTTWCSSYLDTLSMFESLSESLPDDCVEVLEDMQSIIEVNCDDVSDDSSEDYLALMTIEEHLRVGVQLLFEQLNPLNHND